MPSDLLGPLLDPTAPLPAFWPTGMWGAFLLFLVPIGGGIPLGVLMGRDAGVSPVMLAALYFVSDIFMAVTHEPMFWVLAWLARIFPPIARMRDFFAKASHGAGLREQGARGPLGLILFSFTVDPVSGRGAAAAAGHGFIMGWAFAIAGDMIYFAVLMAATLWLSGILGGDEHTTVGIVLLSVWGLSWFIRRRTQQRAPEPAPVAAFAGDATVDVAPLNGRPRLARAAAAESSASTNGTYRYDTRSPRKKANRKRR